MAKLRKRSSKKKKPARKAPVPTPETAPEPAPPADPPAPAARPRTPPLQRLALIAFGLLITAAGLLLLEGALVLFGLGEASRYEDPFVGFEPGADLFQLERRLNGDVYVTSPNKLAFFNHQEFPARKASGTYRVFALGGSTTAGRPYDSQVAFPRWMELYLAELDPTRRFEVVNAGAISYASYRIVVLMQELVRYNPDLFVIYTGHNEFLEERTYGDILHDNPQRRRLIRGFERLRMVSLAREGLRRLRRPDEVPGTLLASEVETKLAGWTGLDAYRRDDALRDSVIEHFEFNLRQMVRIARDHGAEVMFVSPVSNLKDFSPFKSQPSAPFSPEQQNRIDPLLVDGRQALERGDSAAALGSYQELVEIDSRYAEFHFRVGQALFQNRGYDDARRAFVRAKDLDVAPLRALEAISQSLERVASETDAVLVDLPAILEDDCEARYGHRILGNEYLLDHVHPDLDVHSRIAERLIEVMVQRGAARRAASWSPAKRQSIYDRVVGGLDRRYYAYRDLNLAKVLGWSGKLEEAEAPLERAAEILTDEPDLFLNLGILYQKTGRPVKALEPLRRAVELDPSSPEAHFNLGVTYGLLRRDDEGFQALEAAVRLRGDYEEAYYNLGVLARRRGDFDGALRALGKVLELRPEASEAHREIALVYRRQERFDEAVAAFRRALEIDPDDAVARTDLAVTFARQGRVEAAIEELEQAIRLDPGYAQAHYNRGVIERQRGREEAAIAAYRRTIELAPDFVDAYNNLGILLAGTGDLDGARRRLEQAVELRGDYAEAHFNLAVVHDQAGRRDLAVISVKRALEIEPENPRFRQVLELLEGTR